jgi:hypothetical protein
MNIVRKKTDQEKAYGNCIWAPKTGLNPAQLDMESPHK